MQPLQTVLLRPTPLHICVISGRKAITKNDMKEVTVRIEGTLQVPEEATESEIIEAVEFNIGLNGQMELDNPIGMELEWIEGSVDID